MSKQAQAARGGRKGDPWAPFDAWASANEARGSAQGGFSASTTRIYRTLWKGWLAWLAARSLSWDRASAADARRFLEGPAPATARGRPPKDAGHMASYTRQRFFRVVKGVYAHAAKSRPDLHNPMLALEETQRPVIDARSRVSQVLPVGVLAMLRNPETVQQLLPQTDPADWWVLRDRAAIALLAWCGPTAGELTALCGKDLRVGTRAASASLLAARELLQDTPPVVLDLPSPTAPSRQLELPPACLQAVLPWLKEREALLQERRRLLQRKSALAAPRTGEDKLAAELAKLQPATAPLLLSQRAKEGAFPPLESSSAWHAVRRVVAAAYRTPKIKALVGAAEGIAHGAAIVRNTVIREWVDALGEDEAVARAGLRSATSLRMREVPPRASA